MVALKHLRYHRESSLAVLLAAALGQVSPIGVPVRAVFEFRGTRATCRAGSLHVGCPSTGQEPLCMSLEQTQQTINRYFHVMSGGGDLAECYTADVTWA